MNFIQPDNQIQQKSTDLLDQKLVARVQKGDIAAFDLLVVKYQNRVASIVSRFLDSQQDLEDVTQDVFIKAYRAIQSFRGESTFYTWLFRIAINTAKRFLNQKKTKSHFQGYQQAGVQAENNQALHSLDTPENILIQSESARCIEQTLSVMPADLSIALMLRELDGLSYDEIAKVMECPIGTVRSRIFRARELLNTDLNRQLHSTKT